MLRDVNESSQSKIYFRKSMLKQKVLNDDTYMCVQFLYSLAVALLTKFLHAFLLHVYVNLTLL